ncbi:MAG TPA: lipase family protein [Cyclobacteriaceae bacterium]|nr:hypothetical protein [Cyclobacteriaceae bacterium]MCB9236594.1 hypothetical protein [Flammeovirgaceae bacterium]MCB0500796.1 hypothetical protein [Cyclobacteriaceae bacterium]MCO5273082.1 lipase family protein [Cyclobacteriaceae bacterium]MCW5903259.1 hypothetical protein [Cyclobacteriaceae bacterium]
MIKAFPKFPLILLIVLTVSCGPDESMAPGNKVLVSDDLFLSRSAGELRTYISAGPVDIDASKLIYDVDMYKVTYHTNYKGETVTASGLVILPNTTDPIGMVSFQHGTITADDEAPTNLALSNTQAVLYAGMASLGFIGVVPDFIGFGSSADVMHPYYVESLTASSITDNFRAARELAINKGVTFNSRLFLAGYSQGGYATMATHKSIEENGLDGFNLIASFPAAGGYDVKAMQEYFFGLDTYSNPYYMAYVAQAYKTTFDFEQPLNEFFQEPYASRIPSLFDGTLSSGDINVQLTTSVAGLIQPELILNIDTDTKYGYLKDAFIENSLVDWVPTITMFMYHGDADVTVPFENSVITYNKLINNGASPEVVKLIAIAGGTHSTGVVPYVEDFIPKMLSLK